VVGLILTALLVPGAIGMWLVLAGRGLGRRAAYGLALAATLVTTAAVVGVVATDARLRRPWISALGVDWAFATDWITTPLILLTAVVALLVVVHGARHAPHGPPGLYFGCVLLVELGALATFLARDIVVFFVAFEIVLVPMWVLISRYGDPHHPRDRADAAGRFVLYTVLGSSTMLAGILALAKFAGTTDMRHIPAVGLTDRQQLLVALLLTLGLAVKVPLFPLHTWLPPAHTIAPTGGSVLLAAVLLKMGTYGLIRLPGEMTPRGFAQLGPVLAVLGVVGILWGGLACLVERDLKRLIAFSSVAHMGFVALALGAGGPLAVRAAVLTNVAHGVVSALLFVVVGGLKERWGSTDLTVLRPALRETWPRFGGALMVGIAASLGLPGLANFPGEFLSLYAAWTSPGPGTFIDRGATYIPPDVTLLLRGCAIAAAAGAALAAAYGLRVARLVWVGDALPARARAERRPTGDAAPSTTGDMTRVEQVVCGVLALATVVIGLLPWLILYAAPSATLVGTGP
jgi:NADH-quinone oxidoreductase subunit M